MSTVSPSIFTTVPANTPAAPAWVNTLRQQAWQSFSELPMPSRQVEAWRFADLAQLDFAHFTAPGASASAPPSAAIAESAGRIVFVNDKLVSVDASLAAAGVKVVALADADAAVQAAVAAAHTPLGSEKLVALHQANLQDAAVLVVPAKVTVDQPIEIFHYAEGAGASVFPRTIVLAEKFAAVSVLEHHCSLGADSDAHFSCGVTQLIAAEGAKIQFVLHQRRSRASKSIHFTSTRCAKDAQIMHCQLNLGSAWARHECVSHLDGAGSRSDMLGVALTDTNQEADNRTLQLHHAPHAQSDLLYKNVLFGKSRNIFAGLIVVDDGAHFTDAYQTCRNLLLSDECEANAMPGLEINADQVKCSHGSTSGAISPEEIFYLRSRGVDEDQAKALLAQGFLAQTLERIPDSSLRDYLLEQVAARFQAAQATQTTI
jgi:Fe-S cluster assembly protein SufD